MSAAGFYNPFDAVLAEEALAADQDRWNARASMGVELMKRCPRRSGRLLSFGGGQEGVAVQRNLGRRPSDGLRLIYVQSFHPCCGEQGIIQGIAFVGFCRVVGARGQFLVMEW